MTNVLPIDASTTALLIMDFQLVVVENYVNDKSSLLSRTAMLLKQARDRGVTVIYIVVGFRLGFPEINPQNMAFSAIKRSGRFVPGDPSIEIHPAVTPLDGDVVVTKHRVGAFAGTDLEMLLRAKRIDTLLLAGIATSGVVLSTVRYAADADYRLVIADDCCSDLDAEVHRMLCERVFPRQATVASAEIIVQAIA